MINEIKSVRKVKVLPTGKSNVELENLFANYFDTKILKISSVLHSNINSYNNINKKDKKIQFIFLDKYDFGIMYKDIPDFIMPFLYGDNGTSFWVE